jgi:hypothetical protein
VQVRSVIVLVMSIGLVGGAVSFLAKVLMLKGMTVGDVGTSGRSELMELVGGEGVAS